jgi:hypothetical protein
VRWIRSHAGHGAAEELVLSFIQERPAWRVTQAGRGGLITVSIRLNLEHMYIAREMTEYTTAMQRLVQHEQGHVPAWERAMTANLADIASELGSRIRTPATVTPQQVVAVVQTFIRQWDTLCEQAADRWDAQDYPRLHAELARLQVPTFD